MSLRREYLSAHEEPALGGGDRPELDPTEWKTGHFVQDEDESTLLRDSVAAEPALAAVYDQGEWARWLDDRRRACHWLVSLGFALLAGLLAAPIAVAAGLVGVWQNRLMLLLYGFLLGPIAEEFLKQLGAIYQLEKKPWRVFSALQIVLAGAVSGWVFASINEALYRLPMFAAPDPPSLASLAVSNWNTYAAIHVACSVLASFGLVHAWRRHRVEQAPVQLGRAFPWFAVAMTLHAACSLVVWLS